MKCPSCGANIGVRDEFCAWCGKPNERAGRHLQILNRYRSATNATRSDLERQTLRRVPIFVRLLVIVLLLAGFAAVFIVSANSWQWEEDRRDREAGLHASEYAAVLEGYMEKGDPVGFCRFCNAHGISLYSSRNREGSPYAKFRRYGDMAEDYVRIMSATMQLYPFRKDSYRTESELVQRVAENTNYFYDTLNKALQDEDSPLTPEAAAAVDDLDRQLRALLITYLGVDPEDAGRLPSLTDAQRRLLLENSWEAGKEDPS